MRVRLLYAASSPRSRTYEATSRSLSESLPTASFRQKRHTGIPTKAYKGSAWVAAFDGTHAPGRAGQYFDLFDSTFDTSTCSIQHSIEGKKRYHTAQ